MQALKDADITVISMADFLAWRRGEKTIPAQSALITIDDGYLSGYEVAWPILQKFDYPFTMFIYTDYVKGGARSGGRSMTWGQLGQMRDAGVDIQSHTLSHTGLNARKGRSEAEYREWLQTELADSKQALEDNLGIRVAALAYPYGLHNEVVREVAAESGYEVSFTVYGQPIPHDADAMMVGRYAIESTKPKVFDAALVALQKSASSGMSGAGSAMPASVTMVTQPMDGETITNPSPEIKVNLAAFGEIDPKSVTMRLSGVGVVPAIYDSETKLLTYQATQKFYARQVTVIVSAEAGGRKVETRWSFNVGPAPAASPEADSGT
jgi:peptidoglycan/xylan/chitin deacetylase (PgdA/CDA1 family)